MWAFRRADSSVDFAQATSAGSQRGHEPTDGQRDLRADDWPPRGAAVDAGEGLVFVGDEFQIRPVGVHDAQPTAIVRVVLKR